MKVIVVQHGARHRYLIARLLWENDMLEALYTDSCSKTLCGKMAKSLGRAAPAPVQRLGARQVKGIPESRVFATDRVLLSDIRASLTVKESFWMASARRHNVMSQAMIKWGTGKGIRDSFFFP
jgi:hypothetical protein